MPTLRTYNVFISHAWNYNDDYHRIEGFLDASPNFSWNNLSVPEHDPLDTTEEGLEKQLRDQMRTADAFLILGGMYVAHSQWIQFEIDFARRIGRPIIGIKPRGSVQMPRAVANAARETVGWTSQSVVGAIRRHAL